jgi:hypothetical protein
MSRALSSWSYPPRELRQTATRLDNIALVPASELASIKIWQERARSLPAGDTLLVIQSDDRHMEEVVHRLKQTLLQSGRHLRVTHLHSETRPEAIQDRGSLRKD